MHINDKEMNIDEIVKKIRQEINHSSNKSSDGSSSSNHSERQMHFELKRFNLPEFETNISHIQEPVDLYHVDHFMKCSDDEFIQKAFEIIFAESPQQMEIDNLFYRINKGLSRPYILIRMRYSTRGRKVGAEIRGLVPLFLAHFFYRIPVFGKFVRLIINIIRLPRALSDISIKLKEFSSRYNDLSNHISSSSNLLSKDLNAILNELEITINHIFRFRKFDNNKLDDLLAVITNDLLRINNQLNNVDNQLNNVDDRLNTFIEEMACYNQILIPDEMYMQIENIFRGTREDIKSRQEKYMKIIKTAEVGKIDSPIIDIGCGRGEWLELCNELNLEAFGIDMNDSMISHCQQLGLTVIKNDALEYLKNQKSSSLGAITGFHFIEHIRFSELLLFLNEAFRVLIPNGILLIETPNPENIVVSSCSFYYDPTHFRPIPSKLLGYLVRSYGFTEIEIQHINSHDELAKRFNASTDKEVVKLLAGDQDYSLVCYKK